MVTWLLRNGHPDLSIPIRCFGKGGAGMASGRRVRVFWTLAIVSLVASLVIGLAMGHTIETDFFVYRVGGAHLTSPSLYSARIQSTAGPLVFTYPPFAALLFWPLSRLPFSVGEMLWNTLSVVCLWATIAISISASLARKLTPNEWWLAIGLTGPAMLLWPVRDNVMLGQIELLLLAMILLDFFVPLRVGRYPIPQGVLIGLAAAIKLTPLIFVAYLAITGRRTAARTACLSFVGATGAMFAVAPRNAITYWTKDVLATQRITQPLSAGNEALHGFLPRLGLFLSPVRMDLLTVLVLICGVIVAGRVGRGFGTFPGLIVCASVGLIVSPVSWSQHYVWIVPVFCWVLVARLRTLRKVSLVVVLAVIFGWPPLWSHAGAAVRGNWWFFLQSDSYVLLAMCFVVFMTLLVVRTQAATAAASSGDDPAPGETSFPPAGRTRWSESQASASRQVPLAARNATT
jgi:alpha-1,2-mannosyltransferase